MKKEKMARALGLVDDELILKATPPTVKKRSGRTWIKISVAACLTLCLLALNLWLFIPYRNDPIAAIAKYKDSEYYEIMKRMELYRTPIGEKESNFSRFWSKKADAEDEPTAEPTEDGTSSVVLHGVVTDGSYREVTDNQVEGVIEADRFKRTDTHIFYLRAGEVAAYSIAGKDSALVGSYAFEQGIGTEFFLSADGKTLTLIIACYPKVGAARTELISLDVSDPTNITESGRFAVSGNYESARVVNGQILLISDFYAYYDPDYTDPTTFVPWFDGGDGVKAFSADRIACPEQLSSTAYTVICTLNEKTLDLVDSQALLSYTGSVYVSENDIFTVRTYAEEREQGDIVYSHTVSELSRVGYTGGMLEYKGSIQIDGSVKNQYSMDAYNGVLRVVTTTRAIPQYTTQDGHVGVFDVDVRRSTNADLYCIDLSSWQVVASVKQFAPEGETVESVRFDGSYAYVCTAVVVQLTDPVYFFDLSDLTNITYKDTGAIEGYSSALVDFGNGYLLGIGVGDDPNTLKIEVYAEEEKGVVSICKYELASVSFSQDYKAYFIDRERRLIGLDVYNSSTNEGHYVLLHFDGGALTEILRTPVQSGLDSTRAAYIEGYFYILTNQVFKVLPLALD